MSNIQKEIWKDVDNCNGVYQISNLGRFKSKKFGKENILLPGLTKNGYLTVSFKEIGGHLTRSNYVHRLVAKAFLVNPQDYPVVNHIDGDRTNNNVSNLEWCTTLHNMRHAIKRRGTHWHSSINK